MISTKSFAMVFPGQGSQTPLMLQDYYAAHAIFRQTFSEAADVLHVDLWSLVLHGTKEELSQTEITQTLMFVSDIAVWRVWLASLGPFPVVMAGHSLGEYAALVASGAATFADTLLVVQQRARLMDAAMAHISEPGAQGAMLAVLGLDVPIVESLCQQVSSVTDMGSNLPRWVVSIANINSPGQVVIGGHAAAVERAGQLAKTAGAKKLVPLAMSVPSHSPLMQTAADQLKDHLQNLPITRPNCGLINNLAAQSVSDPQSIRESLYLQMIKPVQWVLSVQAFAGWKVESIVECGPGKVLTGLNKRILPDVECYSLASVEGLQSTFEKLQELPNSLSSLDSSSSLVSS